MRRSEAIVYERVRLNGFLMELWNHPNKDLPEPSMGNSKKARLVHQGSWRKGPIRR
jgi:hypothetical protein